MVMAKPGLQNLTLGNKPWAAGDLGHPRVPCRAKDYQTSWPLQRKRQEPAQ